METEILENEIDENQISFDFLNEKPVQVEQAENFDWVAQETLVLIVRSNGFVSSSFELCGKNLESWVSIATSGCKQKFLDSFDEENVLESVRSYAENYNYVVVLFSDTPLLKRETFLVR